ncbi:MAG: MOSC domain-containing protein [Planctomycetaceae bacterium]
MQLLNDMLDRSTAVGKVEWIGLAAERRGRIVPQQQVTVAENAGILGEHHFNAAGTSKRQVTLIQHEHLDTVARLLNRDRVPPELLRRNVVVSGINLASLKKQRFRIGTAVLEATGPCVPCSLMEENLGPGGYAAMIGHGGITAIVVIAGTFRVGDAVSRISPE